MRKPSSMKIRGKNGFAQKKRRRRPVGGVLKIRFFIKSLEVVYGNFIQFATFHLTREKMLGTIPRSDDFREDHDLDEESRSTLKDYKGSGFDREHLAPAGAMKWDERAMGESFLLSNMAPQVGIGFSRHIWKNLETKVRE